MRRDWSAMPKSKSEVRTFNALIMIRIAARDTGIAKSYSRRFEYHISTFTFKVMDDAPRSAAANGIV